MIWMVNALSGKVVKNFIGHEEKVIFARFSIFDGGKQIISCSSDQTLRLWSPSTAECIIKLRHQGGKASYHNEVILCFALHTSRPLVLSGGIDGTVYAAHYQTGEIQGMIGKHTDSVESIDICEELQLAVSGGIDQQIFVYDLKTLSIRHKLSPA